MSHPLVVHCKREPFDLYIGRSGKGKFSVWGNPYRLPDESKRAQVLADYRRWLWWRLEHEPGLLERVAGLAGKRLGCFCAPRACHGDVLAEAAVWAQGQLAARPARDWQIPEAIYFRGGVYSNFELSPFQARQPFSGEWVSYLTNEHFFQAHKAITSEDHEYVRAAEKPAEAKTRGRAIELRPGWDELAFGVMLEGLRLKFARPPRRTTLMSSFPRVICEDSRRDFLWGCRDGRGGYSGENLLGQALMQVRAELLAPQLAR